MCVLSRGTQAQVIGLHKVASGMISAMFDMVSKEANKDDEEGTEEVETEGLLHYFKW